MRKARLWALVGLGAAAFLPPLISVVDFHQLAAPWLFAVWGFLILGTAWAVRRG